MDRALAKEIQKYKKHVKALLICDSKTAKSYLSDLENGIADFVENSGATSIEEVITRFGEPEVVARAFFESADIRKIKRRMNIKRMLLVGVLLAVVIWAVAVSYLSIEAHLSMPGYFVETVSGEVGTNPSINK